MEFHLTTAPKFYGALKKFMNYTTFTIIFLTTINSFFGMEPSVPTIIGSQNAALFQTLVQYAQEIVTNDVCKEEKIRHVCPVCKKSVIYLSQHTKRVHTNPVAYDKKRYKCDKCDSSFKGKIDRLCHSELPHVYLCHDCKYSFITMGKLQRHINFKHL